MEKTINLKVKIVKSEKGTPKEGRARSELKITMKPKPTKNMKDHAASIIDPVTKKPRTDEFQLSKPIADTSTLTNTLTQPSTDNMMDFDLHENTVNLDKSHSLNTNNTNKFNIFTNNTTSTNIKSFTNMYTDQDRGDSYKVIFEKDNINEISTGRLLKCLNFNNIIEIKKVGKNKLEVELNNKIQANKILSNQNIAKIHHIKTYIPNSYIKCVGIVFDIPESISDEELLECSSVPGGVPIEKIERMMTWDKEKKMPIKSKNIKIEFRTTTLPPTMYVFYVHKKVSPFIPRPTLCRKCCRYGHIAKICKSSSVSCLNCCEETHFYNENCNCPHCLKTCNMFCKYCEDNSHNVLNSTCPEFKKQQKLKKIMITQKLPYAEAKNFMDCPEMGEERTTYANIASLTIKIETLQKELNHSKELNKLIMTRLAEAENNNEVKKISSNVNITPTTLPTTTKPSTSNMNLSEKKSPDESKTPKNISSSQHPAGQYNKFKEKEKMTQSFKDPDVPNVKDKSIT